MKGKMGGFSEKEIVVFTGPTCGACKALLKQLHKYDAYFEKHGITVIEKNSENGGRELGKTIMLMTLPTTVFYGKETLLGSPGSMDELARFIYRK
jgi:hypothetical protein